MVRLHDLFKFGSRRAPFIQLLLLIFLGEHYFVMKYEDLKINVKRDMQRKKSGLHVS